MVVDSLRLKPWIPEPEAIALISQAAFQQKNFNVVKIVWQYTPGRWNPEPHQETPDWMRSHFNQVSAFAAQIMEAEGIHGFVYASQTWAELAEMLPFSNALIAVGLNPYAIANNLTQLYKPEVGKEHLQSLNDYRLNLLDVLPGLKNSAEEINNHFNYYFDLNSTWDSHLFRIALYVVKQTTQASDGTEMPVDWGFMNWDDYQQEILEDVTCENFLVRPTGLLRELYWDVTKLDYNIAAKKGLSEHPVHGDMYYYAVETLNSHVFFRRFIDRMLGSGQQRQGG